MGEKGVSLTSHLPDSSKSLKISALVLESNDNVLSFSRQIVDGEAFLERRPKDFNEFQSSLGFPIFSFSFPTTKVFFLSLIKYCTLLRAFFVIFMISALSRLFKFGK